MSVHCFFAGEHFIGCKWQWSRAVCESSPLSVLWEWVVWVRVLEEDYKNGNGSVAELSLVDTWMCQFFVLRYVSQCYMVRSEESNF